MQRKLVWAWDKAGWEALPVYYARPERAGGRPALTGPVQDLALEQKRFHPHCPSWKECAAWHLFTRGMLMERTN